MDDNAVDAEADVLMAPSGAQIIGTLEIVEHAIANCTVTRGRIEYEGGTDVDWNCQETVEVRGQVVCVDEDGHRWLRSQLIASNQPVDTKAKHRPVRQLPGYNRLLELVHALSDELSGPNCDPCRALALIKPAGL